jgi:predicted DCC family thiol-disulfide oxidoreductase YuxK
MSEDEQLQTPGRAIVLFDGHCHFCSGSVRFILKRDAAGRFAFAPLQSSVARQLLQSRDGDQKQLDSLVLDSLVLIEDGRCWTRSTAALGIVRRLSGLWPLLSVLAIVPRPLRDFGYDLFARNRYRWFGRHEACFIPSERDKERFLS